MSRRTLGVLIALLLAAALFVARMFYSGQGAEKNAGEAVATLQLEARFPQAFSYLASVSELSTGEVLLADPVSEVVVRADLRSGKADTLGGVGSGPQEYRGPDRVFALPGDSALLVDLGNGRLTVIAPNGAFVAWVPMARGTPEGRMESLMPDFVDQAGRLYAGSIRQAAASASDSTVIARYSRDGQEEAVVAWAWHPDYAALRSGGKRPMLRATDAWAVARGGRVAVVRANGFSVDWYEPDGTVVIGSSQAVETFPVGDAEREAEIALMMEEAIVVETQVEEGVQTQRMRRGVPSNMAAGLGEFSWPDRLPVFRSARVSPQGDLWVERFMPRTRLPRYEAFNAKGQRLGYVELPADARLVGFGAASQTLTAYLARTDDVGLKWLERYSVMPSG